MSRLIKATHYYTLEEIKLIELAAHQRMMNLAADEAAAAASTEESPELQEAQRMKDQIIRDAESFAEEHIRQAMERISEAQTEAQQEIDSWWNARRSEDEQAAATARQQGFEQGYQEGAASAAAAVKQEYSSLLQEARSILEQAFAVKQQIISESEPFLVDLSCGIAEKIIQKQLTVSPEWVTDIAKSVLSRRRERGLITLCVAPQHFSIFLDAREELLMAIDSQAELQILPDATVSDHGCVVRSAFGSIDARIDTQLKEIKNVLRQLAFTQEGAAGHE